MNCLTGDLMKGIFQSYGTGYRSCHFCISYAYSWSFLFFQHVHNKAACWLLLAWAEYPFLLVQQVQWSAGFFLRGIRPLQGLSRGVFPQTDSKKKGAYSAPLTRKLGGFFFSSWNKDISKSKFLGLRTSQFARNFFREMRRSRDSWIARFDYREIWRSWDWLIAKNKNSVDLSFTKINIASLVNPL